VQIINQGHAPVLHLVSGIGLEEAGLGREAVIPGAAGLAGVALERALSAERAIVHHPGQSGEGEGPPGLLEVELGLGSGQGAEEEQEPP